MSDWWECNYSGDDAEEEVEFVSLWFWQHCTGIYDNNGNLLITSLLGAGLYSLQVSIFLSSGDALSDITNVIQ